MSDELLEWFRFYLSKDLIPIPVEYKGKRPLIKWEPYKDRRPTMDEAKEWLNKYGEVNIALVCSKTSNISALDVDSTSYFLDRQPLHEVADKTWVTKSSKGFHLIFRPFCKGEVVNDKPDVRIKGENSYILVPPSIHPSGDKYQFIHSDYKLYDNPPTKLPAYIKELDEFLAHIRKTFGSSKEKKPRKPKKDPKITWDSLPPCVINSLERRKKSVHGSHDMNLFLRDFFMTITYDDEAVYEILRGYAPVDEFKEETTRKQLKHWWSRRYLPLNCERVQDELGVCDREKCGLKIKNPLVYYTVHQHTPEKPMPKTKETEPIPSEMKPYVTVDSFRPDQPKLIQELVDAYHSGEDTVLNPPTGTGKTLVYTTAAKLLGMPTSIIALDRGTQSQISEYGALAIYGKKNYSCSKFDIEADKAPCNVKRGYNCDEPSCEWMDVLAEYERIMKEGGIVAVNFGNWYRSKRAFLVVIDEFDATARRLCNPVVLTKYTNDLLENLRLNLARVNSNIEQLQNEIELYEVGSAKYLDLAKRISSLKNRASNLSFFIDFQDNAFDYEKKSKHGRAYYVELDIVGTLRKLDKTLEGRKVWVSATPITFRDDLKICSTEYNVADVTNAPIYYSPVTKLTKRNVQTVRKSGEDPIKIAADAISYYFEWGKSQIGTKKAVVYTGNTTTHMEVTKYLKSVGYEVLEHQRGKLDKTVKEFLDSDHDFLCACAIEAGYDFEGMDLNMLFILKVGYPALDERWRAYKKKFGDKRFREEYDRVPVHAIEQLCGRIARKEEKTSVTLILDSEFENLYKRRKDWFTDNFKERLVWRE